MKIFRQAARPLLSDLLSTLIFAGVAALSRSPLAATVVALTIGLLQLAWAWRARRPIGALQWISLGLVAVFGATSVLAHDARLIRFKPTIVYAIVAAAMLERGWMRRYMPAEALVYAPGRAIVGWGYAWAALMALTAALNAGFAAFASLAAWGLFIGLFPLGSKVALFLVQYVAIRRAVVRNAAAVGAV